jgi:dipicolinate synthase subunit A
LAVEVKKVFYVVGGDKRSCYLALNLAKRGNLVYHFDPFCADVERGSGVIMISGSSGVGFSKLIGDTCACNDCQKKILILPVPVTKDGEKIFGKTDITLMDVKKELAGFDCVFGGNITDDIREHEKDSSECQINEHKKDSTEDHISHIFDYMKDDDIARKNAIATAEGAIMDADSLSEVNISESKCLVTGFGRCGMVLAEKLASWGAEVTIIARRKSQREEAVKRGYLAMPFCGNNILEKINHADFIFNTVPGMVIDEEFIENLKETAVVVDIASLPGGVDFKACELRGIKYSHSLSIPGKLSPKTSGDILAEATLAWI